MTAKQNMKVYKLFFDFLQQNKLQMDRSEHFLKMTFSYSGKIKNLLFFSIKT